MWLFFATIMLGGRLRGIKPVVRSESLTQYLYTGDFHTGNIYKVSLRDGACSVFASNVGGAGLCFDRTGRLYCAGGNSIYIVSSDGRTATPFALGFKNALGLTIDSSDNVYCTEYQEKTGKVYKFPPRAPGSPPVHITYLDPDGRDCRITPEGSGKVIDDGLTWPYGLSSDRHGGVYLQVLGRQIYRYSPSGQRTQVGLGAGWGRNAIQDAHGEVFAVGFNVVKISGTSGQRVGMFAPGIDFNHAVGLALDAQNNLYQTDFAEGPKDGKIYKYTPDGRRSVLNAHVGLQPLWIAIWPPTVGR